ncbi:MAG TPA: serine protease [Candidatus Sulfotelmatobacter sp.]|nr:serine protease [Candidatus Sulfotelmatobacter sp.]
MAKGRRAPTAAAIVFSFMMVMMGAAVATADGPRGRQEVIDQIVAGSAKVTLEQAGKVLSSGSGVVIECGRDPMGEPVSYVLTAAHVLEGRDAPDILVQFMKGGAGGRKYRAGLVRRSDPDTLDLALLRVPGLAVPAVPYREPGEPQLGEEILVVGFPWGKRLSLSSGIVSQVPLAAEPGPDDPDPMLMVDAAVAKGVSGGGVFRLATGGLVGIVEGYQTAAIPVKGRAETYSVNVPMPGETLVVPISRIRPFLDDALGGATQEAGARRVEAGSPPAEPVAVNRTRVDVGR